MIVRMSKIAITGPKDILMDVLDAIQELGILQLDKNIKPASFDRLEPVIQTILLDKQTLSERFHLEDLAKKIDTLLDYLPPGRSREFFLRPDSAAQFLEELVDKHTTLCRDLFLEKEGLEKEIAELSSTMDFLSAVEPLLPTDAISPDLDYIGVYIKDPDSIVELQVEISRETEGLFDIQTVQTADGKTIGLITTELELAEKLRLRLRESKVEEHSLPQSLKDVPFAAKIEAVRQLLAARSKSFAACDCMLQDFSKRWLGLYCQVRQWINERLTLIQTTASVFQTEMCFFIFGWLAKKDMQYLTDSLRKRFAGKVVVEEKEILEQELHLVPTILENPKYFKPFELFSRLLPVPGYGSFDMTPFIGIFFPIFFGMMLGDSGYGLILLIASLILRKVFKKRRMVADAARILFVSSCYTIVFGFLYGECFGTVGHILLGMEPIYIDRHTAILPMLFFALSVGIVHIIVGLVLGTYSAVRQKKKKEALFRFISILFILCLTLMAATFSVPSFSLLQKPLRITLGIIIPVLLISGGLLAPLEALKHIGNIISYARIMAIGLTSVLLAYVANDLAGMTGSIWLGVVVGILLHAFNMLLGIFAPTIHALRLHYVEFFSKFMDDGGREFKPLGKKK